MFCVSPDFESCDCWVSNFGFETSFLCLFGLDKLVYELASGRSAVIEGCFGARGGFAGESFGLGISQTRTHPGGDNQKRNFHILAGEEGRSHFGVLCGNEKIFWRSACLAAGTSCDGKCESGKDR